MTYIDSGIMVEHAVAGDYDHPAILKGRKRMLDNYVPPTDVQIAAGETKACYRCKRIWLIVEMSSGKSWCKPCNREWARSRFDPEVIRHKHLVKTYGITLEEERALWAAQGGRCAICKRDELRERHVDHDHRTGRLRAILCAGCNRAIGFMREDAALLRAAADYLESFSDSYSDSGEEA